MPMIAATYLKWRTQNGVLEPISSTAPVQCHRLFADVGNVVGARVVACIFLLFAGSALSRRVAYAESEVAGVTGAARKQAERPRESTVIC